MPETFSETFTSAAPIVATGAVILGVLLWLLGRMLAKPACVVGGLVLGGVGGFSIGQLLADQGGVTLALVIGGAIAGALLSVLVYRLWMGVVGGVLLGLVTPAAMFVWQGQLAPVYGVEAVAPEDAEVIDLSNASEDTGNFIDQAVDNVFESAKNETKNIITGRGEIDSDGDIEQPPGKVEQVANQIKTAAGDLYDQTAEQVRAWWNGLETSQRGTIMIIGGIAAVIGLGFGLLLPDIAAAFQSAVVGAILIYNGGVFLIHRFVSELPVFLPETAGGHLLVVGLITVVGFLIQWIVYVKTTDK